MQLNFHPELIHIYGSFGIHSYGFCIALGIVITIIALSYNKRFIELKLTNVYLDITTVAIIAGCFGGRVLDIIAEPTLYPYWHDWFTLWQGGFSVLGSIIGVTTIVSLYLRYIKVPLIPFLDLLAIYAPLLQSIARLGCFTAGCCYGILTTSFIAVIYTNPHSLALCNVPIHPTQLYSSGILFIIFFCMFFIFQHHCKKPGQLFILYLIFASLERFIVDFWRAERTIITHHISFHQLVALFIIFSSVCAYAYISRVANNQTLHD